MKDGFFTFEDLEFKEIFFEARARLFFNNGFGVSVIRIEHTYGNCSDPYELAVLEGNAEKFDLCYNTPITNDVLGYLTPEEVTEYMIEVQKLEGVVEDEL